MPSPADVTACLVTRGDQPAMLDRIVASLIFDQVVVWNNAERTDYKTAGRYFAMWEARTDLVYFQDDDVIVPAETQQALLDAYEPGAIVANWAHGDNPDGYDDMPLVGAGAVADRRTVQQALASYLDVYPLDDGFLYDADFAAGPLYPRVIHMHLPFEINLDVAQHPTRLCNQPWQADLKRRVADRARRIRGAVVV